MSASSMPWIKLRTTYINDPRVAALSDSAARRFYELYQLAGHLDADGLFILNGEQLTDEQIAFMLHVADAGQVKQDMKELKKAGLLHVNGKGPQLMPFKDEQISQAVRQAEWRDRQKRHRSVTGDSSDVTPESRSQSKSKSKNQSKRKRKNQPPPPTPSGGLAGGAAGHASKPDPYADQKAGIRARAKRADQVLRSAGLREPMIVTLSVLVATRTSIEEPQLYALAGLASAEADEGARNKIAVAAHRMQYDQVEPRFMDPKTWSVLPQDVLAAAGIEDLGTYVTEQKIRKLTGEQ